MRNTALLFFFIESLLLLEHSLSFRSPLSTAFAKIRRGNISRVTVRPAAKTLDDLLYSPPQYLLSLLRDQTRQRDTGTGTEERGFTVADVAAQTGRSLSEVRRDVHALATVSGVRMRVREDGEIFYSFPSTAEREIAARSLRYRGMKLWRRVSPSLYMIYRMSFGVMLLASLAIVAVGIAAAIAGAAGSSSSSSRSPSQTQRKRRNDEDDERDRERDSYRYRDRGFFDPGLHFVVDIGDVFRLISGSGRRLSPGPLSWSPSMQPVQASSRPSSVGFLEQFFLFLFGKEDPNLGFPEYLWIRVAELIRANNGVVVAEQIAPLLHTPPPFPANTKNNTADSEENWMLPVLVQFRGRPHVSKEGVIVYTFPELMASGSNAMVASKRTDDFLPAEKEEEIAPHFSMLPILLGVANLVGVKFLFNMVTSAAYRNQSPWVWIKKFFPLLVLYSRAYLLIPFLQFCKKLFANQQIVRRNEERRKWFALLLQPEEKMRNKLNARKEFFPTMANSNNNEEGEIVYDSGYSIGGQRQ